jgi:two-component system nitrate/nitrite response regulator NarL
MGLPGRAARGASKKSRRPRTLERGATRVFLISAHAVYREALCILLESQGGFRVVGVAADCVAATRPVHGCKPDILLLDLAMAALPDRQALRRLVTVCASTRLVVLVPNLGKLAIAEALLLGVRGVVLKNVPVETLFRSIRAIVSGQYWVGREVVADLVQTLRAGRAETPAAARSAFGLTPRELEILSVLVMGYANKDIARHYSISERTVKHHLTSILHKFGLTSRLELVVFALQNQLVAPARSSRTLSPVIS